MPQAQVQYVVSARDEDRYSLTKHTVLSMLIVRELIYCKFIGVQILCVLQIGKRVMRLETSSSMTSMYIFLSIYYRFLYPDDYRDRILAISESKGFYHDTDISTLCISTLYFTLQRNKMFIKLL